MTKHVTVGVDGSSGSDRALEWAATQAGQLGAELEIIHAYHSPWTRTPFEAAIDDAVQKYGVDILAAAEGRAQKVSPGLVISAHNEAGSPVEVLTDASRDAATVVVGARGHGGAVGAMIGSVGTRLSATAHCPVFVIPDHDGLPDTGPVVVGVDDSDSGLAAMRLARAEAARRHTFIRAVHAFWTPVLIGPVDPDFLRRMRLFEQNSATTVVDDIRRRTAGRDGTDVEVKPLVVERSPAEAILGAAEDAQLIVVGSHGRHLAGRLLLGSVSRLVLHDAKCPVAVVRQSR